MAHSCVVMKLTGKKNPVWKLDAQVAELESSLETVKVLLEQQSPTVGEAQHLLKVSLRPRVSVPANVLLLHNSVASTDGEGQTLFLFFLSMCGTSWMLGTAA